MLRRCLSSPLFWFFGVSIWAVTLYYLSSKSTLPQGPKIEHFDKILHAGYFMIGAFCFYRAMRSLPRPQPARMVFLTTLVFAAAGGLLDEWHQSFTPGRSGNDMGDVAADVVGGLIGATLGHLTDRWWPQRGFRR